MTKVTKEGFSGGPIVPKPTKERLTSRQLEDYTEHRVRLIEWMVNLGKSPEKAEGYAEDTVNGRAYRLDQFYRWVWDEEDRYTTQLTHQHADDWMRELAYGDTSQENKSSHRKAVKMLFRWRAHEFGGEEWESDISFSTNSGQTNPKDYLTHEERQKVRDAVLEYGTVPSYNGLSPEERDRWKAHLAQRFEKPKRDVGPDDFARANSWKIPSLIWTALDTGLRPVEVKRASIDWVDPQNKILRIPKEESSKNFDNWAVSITERTANALSRWLAEREQYSKYSETDALWLNRMGNRYEYYSLNRILRKVCKEAAIPSEGRTFYAIRHSVGTYMVREEDLAAAQAQLRHKSSQTTMRYDQAPVEDRRDALDKMG
ncbi:site-specific integrase [Halorubrum ezzemoulense]|jgi:integrase|uniref:tyrosine-type recombinase/integrase n=1 Tax=Halorubrum ezzemoulense TaxID=337243 RepID=UPI00232D9769|nr:site-specific integrase [Halorubrum ezzemoulense]MDB2276266.1 site-specific integrase [Halorubrum ezzemoulense]